MPWTRTAGALAGLLIASLVGGCAHPGAAGEPPVPPTIVNTGSEYVFEFVPPPGWLIPDAPVPSGALRLTVGGEAPSTARASLMVRAVPKDGDSFETFCDNELGAMSGSFPGQALTELADVGVPGKHSITRQVVGPHRSAIITLVEERDQFMWFGLIVNDPAYLPVATALYRESIRSYKRSPARQQADTEVVDVTPLPPGQTE